MRAIAGLLDKSSGEDVYKKSVENQYKKILNSGLLPSSRIVEEMKNNNENFVTFNLRMARKYSGLTNINQPAW